MTGGGETVPGVEETQQTGAPEAGGSQTQGGQQASNEWRVGDSTFKTPGELHQAALRWQGDFTRVSQRASALEKEMGGYRAVFQAVSQDPRLRQEVMARMQGGQSQQQAVQATAQAHPEMLQHFNSLKQEVEQLKSARMTDEQDRAQYEFREKHQDIQEKEWTSMAEYIGKNSEWFQKAGLAPSQMIEIAYHNAVLPQRYQAIQQQGLQQTQEETVKRTARPLLGSQAATSGARAQSLERPKGKLNPSQERAHAQKVWAGSRPR